MSDKIPDVLYHYCGVDSFMEIVKNKTLRLSYLAHANDFLEIQWAKNLIIDQFKKVFGKIELGHMIIFKEAKLDYYAFCLSEEEDKLSQWRGYADDGTGIAIGFDFNVLLNYLKEKKVDQYISLNKIVYNPKKQISLIKEEIEKRGNYIVKQPLLKEVGEIYEPIFKNNAFKEENEWRLILKSEDDNKVEKNLKALDVKKGYRNKDGVISGYFDLSFSNVDHKAFIRKVVLGPKCKMTEKLLGNRWDCRQLRKYLDDNDFKNDGRGLLNFDISKASYR